MGLSRREKAEWPYNEILHTVYKTSAGIYVCLSFCKYVYTYVYVSMFLFMFVCIYVHIYIFARCSFRTHNVCVRAC